MVSKNLGTMLPKMKTAAPGPKSKKVCKQLEKYESPSSSFIKAGKIPVIWREGKGANIEDVDGNVYVDLTSGFCVAGIGHCNPKVVEAIQKQAGILLHSQGILNPNEPRAELVKKIAEITPKGLNKTILVNTGAEAVELAMKTARVYNQRSTVMAFQGGFHGKTYGALAVTARRQYRAAFEPIGLPRVHAPYPYCYRCPFDKEASTCCNFCAKYLENLLDNDSSGVSDISAIILELIQGHDGWIVPPKEFVKKLREICTKRKILLIADEIITGFGRTGEWFASNYFGIVPDIMIVAKGIAGGFPISAVIGKNEIMDAWGPAMHSSTFLGNPVGTAACLAAIKEIESQKYVEVSRKKGAEIKKLLYKLQEKHPIIGDVRGVGMMMGVELVKDRITKVPATKETAEIVKMMQSQGVIVNQGGTSGNVLKMSPPFVITPAQIKVAFQILDDCISKVTKKK
ncbi:MAG: aspartate aminotransferase family protein [Planctomycetes bacterium]|nr:aspartate aminotransferase family protein [Planctomycetota bacterium]